MALRKSPEEKAQRQAEKAERATQRRKEAAERAREAEKRAFYESPAGLARDAFDEGDHVFQCSFDVMSQKAIVVSMIGSRTTKKTSDPTAILNSVCREGWELLTGDFVFVHEGQQSRDKFASSGQNVAVKGTTMGYYIFRRCEANAEPRVDPWAPASVADLGAK